MNRLYILLIFIFITSCSYRKVVSAPELKEYILNEEHGLYKKTVKNEVTIEAFYRPAELVWARDLAEIHDPQKRKEQKEIYDSLTYFTLHFSRNGKEIENAYVSDPTKFKAVVSYLSFDINNDLFLLQQKDTTNALDVVYSRTFGIADGTSVMAIFNKNMSNCDGSLKLCFNDTMFDTGLTEFVFESNDIKKAPTLTSNDL